MQTKQNKNDCASEPVLQRYKQTLTHLFRTYLCVILISVTARPLHRVRSPLWTLSKEVVLVFPSRSTLAFFSFLISAVTRSSLTFWPISWRSLGGQDLDLFDVSGNAKPCPAFSPASSECALGTVEAPRQALWLSSRPVVSIAPSNVRERGCFLTFTLYL